MDLFHEIASQVSCSNSEQRKFWASEMVRRGISLQTFLPLLHAEPKTAQRFTWLIGDLCELAPSRVAEYLPMLLTLADEMPFPGMRRSLSKWLLLTNVPKSVEREGIEALFTWLESNDSCIASKSLAAKALVNLSIEGRADEQRLKTALQNQTSFGTQAFQYRMAKLLERLEASS